MAFSTALLSLLFDPWIHFKQSSYFDDSQHIIRSCFLMIIGGALAFFMVLMEYILVSATSAVTVTIAGVVKEAVTIVVAIFYFHDEFNLLKGLGLFIIMVGVSLFNWYKYHKLQKGHLSEHEKTIGSLHENGTARYVIVDDIEEVDEEA
ncbi:putative transporter [Nymphaea thermarum]|nr:putative transporter [Nymphaea thermarum]